MTGDDERPKGLLPVPSSDDAIPGMGLLASPDAQRWAALGREIEAHASKARGRPKSEYSIDEHRAFACWCMAQILPERLRRKVSNRELIKMVQLAEDAMDSNQGRLFPKAGSYDASISRGKRRLGIDSDWRSEVCEKISPI